MFEFKLPDLGEGIHEGELIKWYVKEGDHIKEDDPLCDMETDKATVTIPSPRSGLVVRLEGRPGETIKVNSVLVVIDENGAERNAAKVSAPETTKITVRESYHSAARPQKKAIAAPATRRLAREMGIDINQVTGSGPAGKVTKEDLKKSIDIPVDKTELDQDLQNHADKTDKPLKSVSHGGLPFFEMASLPDFEAQGPVTKEPVRSVRKKTAIKTTSSMILIPHVAHMDECDVTELETLRKTYNDKIEKKCKLTLMAFIIKALTSLLGQFPAFNASIDPEKMEIIFKHFFHIGFAADTPKGLMVPVIKDADKKNIIQLANSIQKLAQKGREGTITLPEISNGTFTITNVGAIGGTGMVPTINYPESAILAMGRVAKKPVVKDDDIVIRQILPITLCFDHRVADGAQAANFITQLKQMLEDPLVFMTGI